MFGPLALRPLRPRTCQDSLILRLTFLSHVSSLFCFHRRCHYSVCIISWFSIMSSVSGGHGLLAFQTAALSPGLSLEGN